MKRSTILKDYISTCHLDRTNFTERKLKTEFNSFDRNFNDILSKDKSVNILEIGFGTGYFLKYLLNKGYKNVKGIELSREEAKFVKKNVYSNIEVVSSTINYLKKHENKYDYIFMLQVLEHIPKNEVIKHLTLIKKSLKKNRVFIASVPNAANPFNIYAFGADFTHEFIYTIESLRQVSLIAGFKDVNTFKYREENISWHSKITTITAPIMSFLLRVIIRLNQSYISTHNIYSKDIYCICKK